MMPCVGDHVDSLFVGRRWDRDQPLVGNWVRSTSEIVDLNREASSHGLEPIEEFVSRLSLDDPYLKCLITQQGQYALA